MVSWLIGMLCPMSGAVRAQETPYRVKPVHTPPLVRPSIDVLKDSLPRGATGKLPTFDGEAFQVNLQPIPGRVPTDSEVRALVVRTIRAFSWRRDTSEIVLARRVALPTADSRFIDEQIKSGEATTKSRLSGRLGRLSESTRKAVEDRSAQLRQQAM